MSKQVINIYCSDAAVVYSYSASSVRLLFYYLKKNKN